MFQDMIVKLAEAHAQTDEGKPEAEGSSAATMSVTIEIPPPVATAVLEPTTTIADFILDISSSANPVLSTAHS